MFAPEKDLQNHRDDCAIASRPFNTLKEFLYHFYFQSEVGVLKVKQREMSGSVSRFLKLFWMQESRNWQEIIQNFTNSKSTFILIADEVAPELQQLIDQYRSRNRTITLGGEANDQTRVTIDRNRVQLLLVVVGADGLKADFEGFRAEV